MSETPDTQGGLFLTIVSPEGKRFEGPVESVSAPGASGGFQVLRRHAPLVAALDPGVVKVRVDDRTVRYFAVDSGFLDVHADQVTVLVEHAEEATDPDHARRLARGARDRAAARRQPTARKK